MANKYLEKIAALNPVVKNFAQKVADGLSGKPMTAINNVYNKTHAAVSPRMAGVLTGSEKTSVIKQVGDQASKSLGKMAPYPFEATRGARAGARLARMKANRIQA